MNSYINSFLRYTLTTCFLFLLAPNANAQIQYIVRAKSGLIVREKPSVISERIGKFEFNDTITIKKRILKRLDTIQDHEFKISGNWITVQTKENDKGYVFDGFLKQVAKGGRKKKDQQLLGNVKSVLDHTTRYHYYKSKDSLYQGKENFGKKYVFNTQGYCTEVYNTYNSKDTLVLDYKYEYNTKNQLVKHTNFHGKKVYSIESYLYDKKGQKTEKSKISEGKPNYKWMYSYDKHGNQIEEENYYYDKMRSKRWVSTYDKNNKKLKTDFYNDHQEHEITFNYTYNKDQLIKRSKTIISSNTTLPIEEFIVEEFADYNQNKHLEYNDRGLLKRTKIKRYTKNGILIRFEVSEKKGREDSIDSFFSGPIHNDNRTIVTYDATTGEPIKSQFLITENTKERITSYNTFKHNFKEYIRLNADNTIDDRTTYFYDYKGNLIKQVKYTNNGKKIYDITTYEYIFDKRGNWIEKKEFDDGILEEITTREFTYH
ncbi:SH3 domain-containing protein [Tenacibaculum agarivorans]|uniref:SH3 domain-containing protein n=1 Tax=Tenacibaculum agarivorans TaxID=1908389 RepID=UPI00094BBF98|nr:SH3 domain-containing protein [Tenacibaculum agarivorans]